MNHSEFTLEKNAIDSLEEALNFWEESKIRLTVLLLDNFIELFLKSYIATKHPLLVFRKPSDSDSLTISLDEAIIVIKKLEYNLDKSLEKDIKQLRDIRNELQHYEARLELSELENSIGKILYYILLFDEQNGNSFKIHSYISEKSWSKIIYLKDIFEKHKQAAIDEAKEVSFFGPNDDPPSNPHPICPKCYIYDTTHIEDDLENAYCHFCRYSFPINQCCFCGDYKFLDEYYNTDNNVVADCCEWCRLNN